MLPGRTLRRHGVSLLEVIVILGLLLFLLGLAVSFLFSLRQKAADRQDGQNNLRQLALAMHAYSDTFGRSPPIAGKGGTATEGSLLFHLLPYIEQDAVFRRGNVWGAGTINLRIPTYVDPRDKSAPDGLFDGWLATTNYAGSWPVFKTGENRFPASISDGTSNTIAFAERFQVCNQHPCAWGYDRLYYWAPMFGYYSQGKFQVTPAQSECDPALPQALDRSGIQIAMCDGSARLVSPAISPQTWHYAVTPAGGEVLPGDFND